MNTQHVFALLLACTLLLWGCNRYEEGPGLSIWPAKDRVVNTWKWSLALENGLNRTGERADSTIEFTANEVVRICDTQNNCREGSWNLVTKKQKLQLIFGTRATAYTIRMLKRKEMWLSFANKDSSTVIEWELVAAD